MKTVPYTDADGLSGFLNPEHVSHFHQSGTEAIIVYFTRHGPKTLTNYTVATFRQAIED